MSNIIGLGERAIPQKIIDKYDAQGPRYTSYPTALQFDDNFSFEEFTSTFSKHSGDGQPISLYVHIPFCQNICYYCACNKVVTKDKTASRQYLDYLQQEIKQLSQIIPKNRPVTQLHWGGGSPTFLDKAEMTELMHMLATHFNLLDDGDREYAIEIDPRTVDEGDIALLKGLGFNRISMGIQDFDPLVQRAINRIQPYNKVRPLVKSVRNHGFTSLSFDLIYGLPHQDIDTTTETLNKVIELRPDRVSCYNYAHMPQRFSSQRAIDRLTLPSAEQKVAMQALISSTLEENGYIHIGMDHYVLPEDELAIAQASGRLQRNFQGYSVNMAADLVGIGVSSISTISNYYLQNDKNLEGYYRRLDEGSSPVCKGLKMNPEDLLRQFVIMQLICNLSLDYKAFSDRFNIGFSEHFVSLQDRLADMEQDGLITLNGSSLEVTDSGRPFIRNICMVFDQYLPDINTDSGKLRFSSTL